jgi:Spy/CpxP family protein refolding chaperone
MKKVFSISTLSVMIVLLLVGSVGRFGKRVAAVTQDVNAVLVQDADEQERRPDRARARGQEGRPGGGRGIPGRALLGELRSLGLTDAQRMQVRALMRESRELGETLREQFQQAQRARRDVLSAVPVNEELIRSTMETLADVQVEITIGLARLRADLRALLTSEQVQAMEDRREERTEGMRERLRERAEGILERLRERRQESQD